MTRNFPREAHQARHRPVDDLKEQTIERLLSRMDAELGKPDFIQRQSVWSCLRLAAAASRSRRLAFRPRAAGPWLSRLAKLSA